MFVRSVRWFCTAKLKRPFAEDAYTWRVNRKQMDELNRTYKDSMFHTEMRPIKYLEFFREKLVLIPKEFMDLKRESDSYVRQAQQAFVPERSRALGNDLSAAYFVLMFDGRVRLLGKREWITKKSNDEKCILPKTFDADYKVEAIDFTNIDIYYEGLVHLSQLKYLRKLSFRNCRTIDDWCLNRITAMFTERLQTIDLRGCRNVTFRGLGTFYNCTGLREMFIENRNESDEIQLVCLMLEEMNPLLTIRSAIDFNGDWDADDGLGDDSAAFSHS